MDVDEARRDQRPFYVDSTTRGGAPERAEGDDSAPCDTYVEFLNRAASSIENARVAKDQVEHAEVVSPPADAGEAEALKSGS